MKDFEKRAFFNTVAIKMGIISVEDAERAYYGVVKAIVQGIREREKCEAPDLGVFKIVHHKARRISDVNTKEEKYLSEKSTFKFSPDYKLKKYFHNL